MASLEARAKGLGVSLLVGCSAGGPIDEAASDEEQTATVQGAISSSSTTTIATADTHVCKIVQGGKVICWGDNAHGQLGNGTTLPQLGAVLVSGITNATAIAASFDHTCALLSDGTVRCWGGNADGQLGNATTTHSPIPVTVAGLSGVTAIATAGPGPGMGHSCALLSDSTVKCWGRNEFGQLGNGTTTNTATPVAVPGISTATALAAGDDHTCVLLSDSTMRCWGSGREGSSGMARSKARPRR